MRNFYSYWNSINPYIQVTVELPSDFEEHETNAFLYSTSTVLTDRQVEVGMCRKVTGKDLSFDTHIAVQSKVVVVKNTA